MFRTLRLLVILSVGFYIGFKFKETQMRSICAAGDGNWTGSICHKSEIPE